MKLLENKVAVITGGTRGLGLGIARSYGAAGAAIVIAGRSQATLDSAIAEMQSDGIKATGMPCDVSDLQQVEALAGFAEKTFGKIDIWVNNAGLSAPFGPTAAIPSETFMRVINTNIIGVYNGSVVALRHMLPIHSGKLINLLGRGDKQPVKFQNAYASSKTWVRSFTLALAQENKNQGVDIFAFNPGLVDTDMLRHVDAIQGFEQKLKPLETVIRLWANDAIVPAQKALWLASSATDGKSGMEVQALSRQDILRGLLTDTMRRVMRRPAPNTSIDIHTVMPVAPLQNG